MLAENESWSDDEAAHLRMGLQEGAWIFKPLNILSNVSNVALRSPNARPNRKWKSRWASTKRIKRFNRRGFSLIHSKKKKLSVQLLASESVGSGDFIFFSFSLLHLLAASSSIGLLRLNYSWPGSTMGPPFLWSILWASAEPLPVTSVTFPSYRNQQESWTPN